MIACFRPIIAIPTLMTSITVIGLSLTESYDPAGSPFAPIFLLLMLIAHWQLLLPEPKKLDPSVVFPVSPKFVWLSATILTVAFGLSTVYHAQRMITEDPLVPKASAQVGLMSQVVGSIQDPDKHLLYGQSFQRDGYTQQNGFLPGAIFPYWLARWSGFEWRMATVVSLVCFFSFAVLFLFGWWSSEWKPAAEEESAISFFAFFSVTSLWFFLPENLGLLSWFHQVPLWPLMMVFGIAIARGIPWLAALAAGSLAAMSPGWVLMLLPISVFLCKMAGGKQAMVFLAIPVLLSFGFARGEWEAMGRGVLGDFFTNGESLMEEGLAWRYVSLHAIGDWLLMRPAIYAAALVGLLLVTYRLASSQRREHQINYLAVASFIVILCAPASYTFHWIGHGIWLAALLPASTLASEVPDATVEPRTILWTQGDWLRSGLAAAAIVLMVVMPMMSGLGNAIEDRPFHRLQPDEYPLYGFHYAGFDGAWGKDNTMTIGIPVEEPQDGLLEIRVGTFGGRFVPMNPFQVKLNGIDKGTFFIRPGDYKFALVNVKEDNLHYGINYLEIEPQWWRSPASFKAGEDTRELSLNFQGLRFLPGKQLALDDDLKINPTILSNTVPKEEEKGESDDSDSDDVEDKEFRYGSGDENNRGD